MLQGELKSEHMHAVYTAGTAAECEQFVEMIRPTLEANGLTWEVKQHYKRIKGEHQPRYSVETHLLPKVAHTVVALTQGGKVKEPITGDDILQYLQVHQGNLAEWVEYAKRGLTSFVGKNEDPMAEVKSLLYPPTEPSEDPTLEVRDGT